MTKQPLHPMYEEYRDPVWLFPITNIITSILTFVEYALRSIPIFGRVYTYFSPVTRVAPMTAKTNPPPKPHKLNPPQTRELYEPNSTEPTKTNLSVIKNYDFDINELVPKKN
ncbi:predicted protein [Naegleria gruberi]|uniref:Predicted protein n=1 Tax=Naegleria gruberi TaxID=5762 RepID=D2V7E0_NAEGR|nr:uncharacterized protein NAEGRDRAFT_64762 [Naegleria gruberi]EFC47359.1 predicted protein [Naegleria gruberi]|eukprot:XP_002680103.1 predicted protein [Naegleria gruberi strain NEG-M]